MGERERPHRYIGVDVLMLRAYESEGVGVALRIATLGADVDSSARCEMWRVLTVTEICTQCSALSNGVA